METSRREFIKNLATKKESQIISEESESKLSLEKSNMSRRDFLKFASELGIVITLGELGIKDLEASQKVKEKDNNELSPDKEKTEDPIKEFYLKQARELEKWSKEIPEGSYVETAVQTGLMMGAEKIAEKVFEVIGIKTGNPSLDKEQILEGLKKHPIMEIITGGLLGPAIEEAIFRLLPSRILGGEKTRPRRWDVGIPISFLFALGHNIKKDELGKLGFEKSVPINQFLAGLFYWYLMRKKGFSHALLAHSMENTISLAIAALLPES